MIKSVVDMVQPIIEEKIGFDFKCQLSKNISSTITSPEMQRNAFVENIKNSNKNVEKVLAEDNIDVMNFLASGKSYNLHENDRMNSSFVSKEKAKKIVENKLLKEKSGKSKAKVHCANFDNYNFKKEEFINEISEYPPNKPVNWTRLAKKYNVTRQDQLPANAGQVLMQYAKSKGVDVFKFNQTKRVSGRDYLRRVRRSKIKLKHRISIPTVRSAKKIKQIVKQKLETNELYIGEKIAPKLLHSTKINDKGALVSTESAIFGRKIPLINILKEEVDRFREAGVLKVEQTPTTGYNNDYKTPRTLHLKFWHDHSKILNQSYVNFMVSFLYDKTNFLTDIEFTTNFPEKPPLDVQSFVEKPRLYIFGKSGSSDKEQLTYTETRLKDLNEIKQIAGFHITTRVFTGDNPARQFEGGQQRGGNFSCLCGVNVNDHQNLVCCYRTETTMSLDDRRKLVTKGEQWKKMLKGETNPFQKLKKEELESELQYHGYNASHETKGELQEALTNILHGICRPPALMCNDPLKPANELNIEHYEVLCCEPLHDISNVIQNLITELPMQVPDSLRKEFETFSNSTIGDKKQLKGSDSRLFAIKLSKFIATKYAEGKIEEHFVSLINSLVDIIQICYSSEKSRNPRQILRLFNQCFIFATLSKTIFGKPSKMTTRKFFGSHFHSITVHIPETFRLFCLRSIIPEQEERSFGDLRQISLRTSNRQAKHLIDNAVLRFNIQQKFQAKQNSFKKQDSAISHQAKLLEKRGNSTFAQKFIQQNTTLFQSHLERIADFMLCGENVWWSQHDDGIEFHDSSDEVEEREAGPPIHHFGSSSLQRERIWIRSNWHTCLQEFSKGKLALPLKRLRDYDGAKLKFIYPPLDQVQGNTRASIGGLNQNLADHQEIHKSNDENPCAGRDQDDSHSHAPQDLHDVAESRGRQGISEKLPFQSRNPAYIQAEALQEIHKSNDENPCAGRDQDDSHSHAPQICKRKEGLDYGYTDKSSSKKPCQRRLFVCAESENIPNKIQTTTELLHYLLGDSKLFVEYKKYRRLSRMHPSDKSFKQCFDSVLARVQTTVSKIQNDCRKDPIQLKEKKKICEQLMVHWGMYFF